MTTQKLILEPLGSTTSTDKIRDDESTFPALKHRPAAAVTPAPAKVLAPIRAALQKNPAVNLPEDAAGVITAGLTDPHRFRLLTESHAGANGDQTSLLNRKRVSEGVVFVTPQHDRFVDMGVIPDLAGARWRHTLHNQLDVQVSGLPAARLGTAGGPEGPWAMLELEVEDHQELTARVREAFAKTGPDQSTAGNDYTDSILQSGVKEPLLLVPLQVRFHDGSDDEYYLVSIDGNSRLVSMWKGRTGGNVDQAAAACIETVIGAPAGKTWRRATQRQTRDALIARVELVNRGLLEDQLTESTIRWGHTLTAPAVVVVGGWIADSNDPLTDLVAAREDLIATIHTDATPWDAAAQAEQGMSRLLRRAVRKNLLSADERRVIEGRCTSQEMHEMLGLPPHRLWAAALTLQLILNPWYKGMSTLFREEFNSRNHPTRLMVGKQIASTALSGYRSSSSIGLAVNAFSDGGPIAAPVWDYRWTLAKGGAPLEVLTSMLEAALAGDTNAVAQLCVLGGTAGMLAGLITRDRGSKLSGDGRRAVRQVPFRARPYRVVEQLAMTQGGLKTLHSMAVAHVTGKPAKQFYSTSDPEGQFADGDAVIDQAGAHANLEMEWDVVVTADPQRAAEAIAAASPPTNGTTTKPQDVRLRENLQAGTKLVLDSVDQLTALAQTRGADVFGSYDAIHTIKAQLQDARDKLHANGPTEPLILNDEDDEVDA